MRVQLERTLELSSVHRPILTWDRDGDTLLVGVSWGNRYTDPVWSLHLIITKKEQA